MKAKTGSVVKHWVGLGLGLAGLGTVAAGGLYLLASDSSSSSSSTDAFGNNTHNQYKTIGIVQLVIGAILMAVGFPMFASQSTKVQVD